MKEKCVDLLHDREVKITSSFGNIGIPPIVDHEAKAVKVNKDKSKGSIPYSELIEMNIIKEENEELEPISFVAVSPITVKYEEPDVHQSASGDIDPLSNDAHEEYPHDSSMTNVMNLEKETDCESATEIKNEIKREIDIYKCDLKISEKAPILKEDKIIPETEIFSFSGELKQSSDELSGTIEGNEVVASDDMGDTQSYLRVSLDGNDCTVRTVSNSFKGTEDVEIKFESVCDISENELEEKPFLYCQNTESAEDDRNEPTSLTKERGTKKSNVNQLGYQFEEVNQPTDGVEISHCSSVSCVGCGWWRTQIKHIPQAKDIAVVFRDDKESLSRSQSETNIMSEVQCNVNLASPLQNNASVSESKLTFEDPFADCEEELLPLERNPGKHVQIHTEVEKFASSTCRATFTEKNNLVCHTRIHGREKLFKCSYCNASFSKQHILVSHTRTHTGERPFECVTCNASFSQKRQLKRHIQTHTKEKPYKCITCNASFCERRNLVVHTRIHTGEKPFICVTCNASFCQRNSLVSHMRTHTGEKPFQCVTCGASFSQKNSLVSHMRIHTGERPFKCVTCDASFRQKHSLVSHIRSHTGERPFKCVTCKASYTQRHHLKRHIQFHLQEKPFSCTDCTATFARKYHLVTHIRTHSGI